MRASGRLRRPGEAKGRSVVRGPLRSPVFRSAAWAGLVLLGVGDACAAEDARLELDEVVKRLNALDTWLDDAGERIAKGQSEVASADRRVADANRRIRELDARIEAGDAELQRLGVERERLGNARRRQGEQVAQHLRDAWRFKERDPLRALLNLQDPRALDRMVRYHAAFAKARLVVVDELRETLTQLEQNQLDRDREQRTLAESRKSVAADRAGLIRERGERRSLIESLNAELAKRSEERDRLNRDRDRLASLIDELARAGRQARGGLDAVRQGELAWPVQGRLVRRFGESRAGGRLRWEGVAFEAPEGSEVRAVAPGQVVFADWLRGFGMLAIVDHGDGWMSLYGSVDAIYKRRGDPVESGEVIATVGQSGAETEVGLYFEVRHNGEPKDPLAWLKTREERSR